MKVESVISTHILFSINLIRNMARAHLLNTHLHESRKCAHRPHSVFN